MYDRYTFESFGEIAFGHKSNLLTDQINESTLAAHAYDTVQQLITQRTYNVWWRLHRWLQIKNEKKITECLYIIDTYAYSIIKHKHTQNQWKQFNYATNSSQSNSNCDLLDRYMWYADTNSIKLTDRELRDVVINFIVAGRDTTACLLSWCTYELTQHPEWQDNIFNSLFPNGKISDIHDSDKYAHHSLVQAFLHETLRLHPSVPSDSKQAQCNDRLPDGTHVSKGSIVRYSPYLYGRSTTLWYVLYWITHTHMSIEQHTHTNTYMLNIILICACVGGTMQICLNQNVG